MFTAQWGGAERVISELHLAPGALHFPLMVTRTKKIFVGGLSANTVVEDVKQYFEQFGKVDMAGLCLAWWSCGMPVSLSRRLLRQSHDMGRRVLTHRLASVSPGLGVVSKPVARHNRVFMPPLPCFPYRPGRGPGPPLYQRGLVTSSDLMREPRSWSAELLENSEERQIVNLPNAIEELTDLSPAPAGEEHVRDEGERILGACAGAGSGSRAMRRVVLELRFLLRAPPPPQDSLPTACKQSPPSVDFRKIAENNRPSPSRAGPARGSPRARDAERLNPGRDGTGGTWLVRAGQGWKSVPLRMIGDAEATVQACGVT
ncbi:hypothetical protein P4O66_003168 [Electrophorus voltai]|uniref:RRM domain-containing protein n=1 Tax=Electrophorus voltai TaxID=2609070 RepID=A0AAD8YS08_9TELE|nr:hypothetical protein P4O66_003168 [Electrophorus voltai]